MAFLKVIKDLVDGFGRPVNRKALLVEQSAPSLGSVRNIISGHPADGLTPQRLASILREAEQSNAIAYLELAEQMEERDLHYLGVLGKRKRSISQLEINVEDASNSADDKAAGDLIRGFVDRLQLQDELFDILDAIGKGFSVTQICWDTSMSQWMPRELKYRQPKWFRFSLQDGETLELWDNAGYLPLEPYAHVVHRVKAKSGLAIRGGLARAAAWSYLFKNFDVKAWVIFAETYGQPIRVGKYGPGASKEDKSALLRALSNIASDCAAMIPESMMIEFIEAKMTGSTDLYGKLAAYLDQQMSKAVLGNTGTTDAIAGGHAVGKVHRQVELDIERSDAKALEFSLNRDLVKPMIDLNMGPRDKYPVLRLVIQDDQDAAALATAVSQLVDRGLRVGQTDMRRRIGIDEPKDGEELLVPAIKPANPGVPADGPNPDPAKPTKDRLAAHSQERLGQQQPAQDSIDALIAEQMADWQPMTMPLMQPVLELVAQCASFDELLAGLPGVIPAQNSAAMAEALAKCLFAARLAGATRAPIGPT